MFLDALLFRYRYQACLGVLLTLVGLTVYMWFALPFAPFTYNWRPDHALQVAQVTAGTSAVSLLKKGDRITAIDGERVNRSQGLRFAEAEPARTHTLTILRDGVEQEVTVSYLERPTLNGVLFRTVAPLLSVITLIVGAVALYFATPNNYQAIRMGGIFLLASLCIISWNATLMGAPFAWLTSQPLLPLVGVGWIYLGFLPQQAPLSQRARLLLYSCTGAAVFVGLLALLEGALLFPNDSSWQALVGVSLYGVCALFQVAGCFGGLAVLLIRRWWLPAGYQRRQVTLLIYFNAVGFLPPVLLTFLPLGLTGTPLLPMQLSILNLLVVPLGYLYIVFRNAYLNLDTPFSRLTTFTVLAMLMTAGYGGLLQLGTFLFGSSILLTVVVFFIFALLLPLLLPRVDGWARRLFFADFGRSETLLTGYLDRLNGEPAWETLSEISADVCRRLNIPRALLVVGFDNVLLPYGNVDTQLAAAASQLTIKEPLLRTVAHRRQSKSRVFEEQAWAELLIPVVSSYGQDGLWILDRPTDGHFDKVTVQFLEKVAVLLANGKEVVRLLTISRNLTLQMHQATLKERYDIGHQLHSESLNLLFNLQCKVMNMRQTAVTPSATATPLDAMADDLTLLDSRLRDIYSNIYPSCIENGVVVTVETVVSEFRQAHRELTIDMVGPSDRYAVLALQDVRLAQTVYTILHEALNNVVKHANATMVHVRLRVVADDCFELTVVDNGTFDDRVLMSSAELLRYEHFGLAGMQSQAQLVGGKLTISSQQPSGTCIVLQLSGNNTVSS